MSSLSATYPFENSTLSGTEDAYSDSVQDSYIEAVNESTDISPSDIYRVSENDIFVRYSRSQILPKRQVSYESSFQEKNVSRFKGVVKKLLENSWVAVLKDDSNPLGPDEVVEFSYDEVNPCDMNLLQEGALFDWFIAQRIKKGQQMNIDRLSFRRLPKWSAAEISQALESSSEYMDLFD